MLAAFSIQPISAQTQELSPEEIQRLIEQVEEISKEDAFLKESQAPGEPHHSHCEVSLSTGTGFITNVRAPTAGLADMSVGGDIFARAAILFRDPRTEIRRSPSGALWGVLKRSGAFVSIVYFRGLLGTPFAPQGIYAIKAVGSSLGQQIQAFLSVPGVFSKDLCSPVEECRLEAGETLTICTLTVGEPCVEVAGVPDFDQFDVRWATVTYDNTDPPKPPIETIKQAGCLLSCYADVLTAFGLDTDSLRLNKALIDLGGFDITETGGWVRSDAIETFAANNGLKIKEDPLIWHPPSPIDVLKSILKENAIPIITVYSRVTQATATTSGMHAVVVDKICGDGFDQVFIKDPGSDLTKDRRKEIKTLQDYFDDMVKNGVNVGEQGKIIKVRKLRKIQ